MPDDRSYQRVFNNAVYDALLGNYGRAMAYAKSIKSNDSVLKEKISRLGWKHNSKSKYIISMKLKNRKFTKEHKRKISQAIKRAYQTGKFRGFKNKHHTKEFKEKIGKLLSEINKNNIRERNSNWRGGISFLPYAPEFNRYLKKTI